MKERLMFVRPDPAVAVDGNVIVANLDDMAESGVFVEGTTRSGKTNAVRVFCEETYGLIQHIILDPEGQYATLRSAERPYLVVGKGRDVEIAMRLLSDPWDEAQVWEADASAVQQLVLAVVEKKVSVIFDLSEYDLPDQQIIVGAVCDALVSLPESHAGTIACIVEEMQDFAARDGGKDTALPKIRRLAKRGLKRGIFIVGVSQRVSDVSRGVTTQLKTKIIGGTDYKDAKPALEQLGLPSGEVQLVTELEKGHFWVKGPAFERHAQLVVAPLAQTAPPRRRRGEPPAPAAEAPQQIADLAALLKEQAAADAAARAEAEAEDKKVRSAHKAVDRGTIAGMLVEALNGDDESVQEAIDAAVDRRIRPIAQHLSVTAGKIRDALEGFEVELAS